MNEAGFYDGYGYRLWIDKGILWLSLGLVTVPIPIEDAPIVAELMLRAFNDPKREKKEQSE